MLILFATGCKDSISQSGDDVDTSPVEFFDVELIGMDYVFSTSLSYDGSMIAVYGSKHGGKQIIEVVDTKTKAKLCEFPASGSNVYGKPMNFSDDGTKFLVENLVINPMTGNVLHEFKSNPVRLLPDGSAVIFLSSTQTTTTFSLYSVANGSKIKEFQISEPAVFSVAGTRGSSQIILMSNPEFDAVRVINWDISSNSKVGDFTVQNSTFLNGGGFSTDFSILCLPTIFQDDQRNFYNSQTGERINKEEFIYPESTKGFFGDIAIANDQTFMIQSFNVAKLEIYPPSLYSIKEVKRTKILTLPPPANSRRLSNFAYSGDNRFFSAEGYVSSTDPNLVSIRIWKLK